MRRIRTTVLLAALLALATGLAACGGGGGGDGDAEEVVQSATLEGIESGKFDLALDVSSAGETKGDLSVSLSGAYQEQAGSDLPQLQLTVDANGEADGDEVDFEGGLTLLEDRAYVGYEGTEYEVDPTTFNYLKSSFGQPQQAAPEEGEGGEGAEGDATACQDAAAGIDLATLIDEPRNEGSAEVEGQETTQISGELDIAGAAEAVVGLSEDPACAAQLEAAGPLPLDELDKARDELSRAVKKADVDLFVGDDGIVRRVAAELVVEPEKGGGTVSADLELTISDVNEDQEISAPSQSEPLEGLFQNLGVNPLALLEGSEDGIAGLLDALTEVEGGSAGGEGGGSSGGEGSGSGGEGSGSGGEGSGSGGEGSGSGGEGGGSGSGSAGSPDLDQQQAYLECLKDAQSAADLQKCAELTP